MSIICHKWGECNVLWKNADWKWSECQLVAEIIEGLQQRPGVPGEAALPSWLREEKIYDPYEQDKRRRFIELLAKVKGEKDFGEKRQINENVKISVHDVKLVVKKVSGIDISILE